MTKREAIKKVQAAGYTEFQGEGESGDHGYGSRLYYAKPNAPVNRFNVPLNIATVSKVGREWLTYIPEGN
jgi:hypothetical protein